MSETGLLAGGIAAGVALLLTPLAGWAARRAGVVDRPGPGKIHREPVPTLGGLAVVAAVLGALWWLELQAAPVVSRHSLMALSCAALPVLFVSVVDDVRGLGVHARLLGHLLAGGILYSFGLRVAALTNPFGESVPLGLLSLPLTLLWVAALVNAMNLVDGLDGLAAGVAAIAALSLARVGSLQGEAEVVALGLVVAAAAAGFFPYNYPRARVFLGDAGSTFIGLALATLALLQNRKTTTTLTLLIPILALGLPVLDTAFAVARRTLHGRSPLFRDLGHLHHRLLELGLKPQQAVVLLLGATAVLGELALGVAGLPKQQALLATASLALLAAVGFVRLLWLDRRRGSGRPAAAALQKA